jgi:hypothetical protein
MLTREFKDRRVPVNVDKKIKHPNREPTKSYICAPKIESYKCVEPEYDTRLSDLQSQVAMLTKSYAELLKIHSDQLQINQKLIYGLSTISGCILSGTFINFLVRGIFSEATPIIDNRR